MDGLFSPVPSQPRLYEALPSEKTTCSPTSRAPAGEGKRQPFVRIIFKQCWVFGCCSRAFSSGTAQLPRPLCWWVGS